MLVNLNNNYSIYLPKIFGGKNNATQPIKQQDDVVQIRSYVTVMNERLAKVYGIKSTIENPKILAQVVSSIDDFCQINNNNKLFNGLIIDENALDDSENIYENQADYNTKEFKITFNSNFDWDNIREYTKENYNNANIGSDNPKFFLYKGLASFLNFDYNPYAYVKNDKICPTSATLLDIRRFSNAHTFSDFTAEYVAAKMCSCYLPKILDLYFEERTGNIDLKFPKTDYPIKPDINDIKFSTIKEAQNHLKSEYGIDSEFNNLKYANECVSAVKELSHAIGDKNIFNGLKIKTTPDEFESDNTIGTTNWNANTKQATIYINPAYNWKIAERKNQKDYDNGFHPSNKLKNNLFIHELSHWLDFKGNPERYSNTAYEFNNGTYFNDNGIKITGRVSQYGARNPLEFCAEYISGRLDGNVYPDKVNKEFEYWWNGPKINFP